MAGKVKISEQGPSGKVQYSEGLLKANTCEFYWEFGGGKTIATVWFPTEEKWQAQYPWAAGRRMEILNVVAAEVRKQKAKSSRIEWEADRFHLLDG